MMPDGGESDPTSKRVIRLPAPQEVHDESASSWTVRLEARHAECNRHGRTWEGPAMTTLFQKADKPYA